MKILDKYILKKYITTLLLVIALLLPIAIAINVSEKIDKLIRSAKDYDLTFWGILKDYYGNFIIVYGNTFMPLALFIAVIFFTSKLANNTEIIAIHSAKISFNRFLYPYFIGAVLVFLFSLTTNHLVVPKSNKTFNFFERNYIQNKKHTHNYLDNVNLQLSDSEYIFFNSYTVDRKSGNQFSYEKFKNGKLTYKLMADNISWNEKDSTYSLTNYQTRIYKNKEDKIHYGFKKDTTFNFFPEDLVTIDYLAKEMPSPELKEHIQKLKKRGVKNLNAYLVELYKRTSMPASTFILTIIAVALSSRKKRGGMGINLALGISLMFIYVFFLKISEVLGAGAEVNPLLMVWLPNIFFGILATYLYIKNVKK